MERISPPCVRCTAAIEPHPYAADALARIPYADNKVPTARDTVGAACTDAEHEVIRASAKAGARLFSLPRILGGLGTTLELTPIEIDALRHLLEEERFSIAPLEHGHFQARGPDLVVNAYRSGKVVVQGKGADRFLERHGWAKPKSRGLSERTVGSDESGKGDYFGPMVVAAAIAGPGEVEALRRAGVRDSKKMGDEAALRAAVAVRALCPHAVRVLMPADYNARHEREGNVALFLADLHAEAIAEALSRDGPVRRIVIDQFTFPERLEEALARRGVRLPLEIRPRAEDNPAVAAASVLARAEFLIALRELGHEFGTKLPKGAGEAAEGAARAIFRAGGVDALRTIAKIHFRTTSRLGGG